MTVEERLEALEKEVQRLKDVQAIKEQVFPCTRHQELG